MDNDKQIIEEMRRSIHDVAVVKEGLQYIQRQSSMNDDQSENAQKRRKELIDKGASAAVIDAMKVHVDNVDIQHYACWALRYLSVNDNDRMSLMKIGAGEAIINAMNNHKDNTDVQYFGCEASWSLSINNDNKVKLMRIGIGKAIINAMNNHEDNPGIQGAGCAVLRSLSVNADNQVTLMNIGTGESIINALNNHKHNSEIQSRGCNTLTDIISSDQSILEAFKQGLDLKIVDFIQHVIDSNNDTPSASLPSTNSSFDDFNKLKDRIMKYEKEHPDEVRQARIEHFKKTNALLLSLSEKHEKEINQLRNRIEELENEKAEREQQHQHEQHKILEEKELREVKLESYLSSQLENDGVNFVLDQTIDVIDNQVTPAIDHLMKSRDIIVNNTEIYEMLLKVERFERMIQSIENAYERITSEQFNQRSDKLMNQSKHIDLLERELIDDGKHMNKELLKQKGIERDTIRENMVKEYQTLKTSIQQWNSKMQLSTSSNEWQEYPNIQTKLKQINPISIKNNTDGMNDDKSNRTVTVTAMHNTTQPQDDIRSDQNDLFVGNEMIHDMITRMDGVKQSIDVAIKSSNEFNQYIHDTLMEKQMKAERLVKRQQIAHQTFEQEMERIGDEIKVQSTMLECHIIKNEQRKQIKILEDTIERKDDEINLLTVTSNEIRLKIAKEKKTLSTTDKAKLEQEEKEAEESIKVLKLEYQDLIDELNGKCHDENGKCILPDLLRFDSINPDSNSISNDLIKITEALKVKSYNFKVQERIGDGGFSSVFKVNMRNRGKKYVDVFAFKQFDLSPNVVKQEEIKVIEREIEMLSQLKHDNIVKIIGAIGDPNAKDINNKLMGIGIVMEYCENGSLRSLLNKNTNNNQQQLLNMDLIIHLLLGAAQGLEYLHNHIPHAIINGDIKSDNILIDEEYNAKLCDFGISKLQQSSYASSATRGDGGTIAYKAPERFEGKMECASDVYSFGCVILEILTGERPWSELGNDVGAIVTKVLVIKEQHDLSKIRKDAKEELIYLMKRCLDYDKGKRPSMQQVRMELEQMMNNAVLITLDDKSDEYNKVENLFFPGEEDKEGSLNRKKCKIVRIDKIRHLFAERRYDAELSNIKSILNEDDANEKLLFHGTSQTDPMMILNHPDAFMKDYSSQGLYGRGLYFAEKARYSNAGYRYNIPSTNQHQLFVCSVICGKLLEFGLTVNQMARELSHKNLGTDHHSIQAGPLGFGEDKSCMYVVYKDTQVVARYLITYEPL